MGLTGFSPASPTERDEILGYLHSDLGNCLYLYLDIDTYEIGGGVIDVWLQRDEQGQIAAVLMRYADSFQAYARDEAVESVDYDWLVSLARELDVTRISAPGAVIRQLLAHGLSEDYDDSYGIIQELVKYRKMSSPDIAIEKAAREDIPEIARLIRMDEMFAQSYDVESLIRQFEARYDEGMGASYIIRVDGKIVAHLGLSAISKDFVIASYTIVDPTRRDYPYGAFLDSNFINNTLPSMGKRGFAFMQEPRRIKLFDIMGNPTVGEYGKLLKKQ